MGNLGCVVLALRVTSVSNVVEARFLKRPNRFVVEALLRGEEKIRCLNTNTGRLHDLLYPGARLLCSRKERGRTSHRLVAVITDRGIAIVDTSFQMRVFEKLVEKGAVEWLNGCHVKGRSPRVGSSILDYRLECGGNDFLVELKSAVLAHGRYYAGYPDCPTDRGIRHLSELAELADKGIPSMLIFIAALPGARAFMPFLKGDPRIKGALEKAVEKGVRIRALGIEGLLEGGLLWVRLYASNLPIVLP